jgi:hypothetical protein
MNLPEFSNTQTLIIEIVAGIIIALLISVNFGRKQDAILKNIHELTEQQSKLIGIMESRRRERIRWFKHISLTLLNSIKERYKMLSAAVDRYAADESEENRKKIESIASTSILITANAQDLIIKREIPNAAEYIEIHG